MDTDATAPDKTYTVLSGGESVFDVAAKVGLSVSELMEHNGINQYSLPENIMLHLPYATEKTTTDERYAYDLWPEAKRFYINNSNGSKKYAFGNAKSHTDIFPVGSTNKQFKVVEIAGLITITFSPERVYSYYIETVDMKDGRIKNTIGYPKEYLIEGESPAPVEQNPNIDEVKELLESVGDTLGAIEPEISDEPEPEPVFHTKVPIPVLKTYNDWKGTYADLPDGPAWYCTRLATDVFDYDGKRPTKYHFFGRMEIAGTFIKDGTEYGRPIQSVKSGNWYGIKWDNLEDLNPLPEVSGRDGEDYEITMPNEPRKQVYKGEELFRYVIAKPLAHTVKAVDYAKKVKRKII